MVVRRASLVTLYLSTLPGLFIFETEWRRRLQKPKCFCTVHFTDPTVQMQMPGYSLSKCCVFPDRSDGCLSLLFHFLIFPPAFSPSHVISYFEEGFLHSAFGLHAVTTSKLYDKWEWHEKSHLISWNVNIAVTVHSIRLNSVAGSARGWTTLTCTTLCLEQNACTSRVTQLCC